MESFGYDRQGHKYWFLPYASLSKKLAARKNIFDEGTVAAEVLKTTVLFKQPHQFQQLLPVLTNTIHLNRHKNAYN